MTEAESIELVSIITANALTGFTIYISFTFAFLTAVHFVGDTLTRVQAISASVIYLLCAGSAALTTLGNLEGANAIMNENPNVLSSVPMWNPGTWQIGMSFLFFVVIIASLVFFYSVRNGRRA